MGTMRHFMKLGALFAFLGGCTPKPQPAPKATVASLHFPVVVLYANSSSVLYKDAADLGVMNINHVINPADAPVLIDSRFDIYTLEKLQSTHGGLWLMAHPSGSTEVTFDLMPAPKSGLEAAREATRTQLDKQTWRTDLEEKRKSLATQKTLAGMRDILRESDQ